MKLLLDENLPHQLRLELPGHDVFTTALAARALRQLLGDGS